MRASSGSPQRTVEELSEEIGWAWYQWRLFIFVGLCVAADAIEVNLLSYVSVETTKDWQLEEFGEDTISAAVFGGQAVGCAIFGTFADRYGRLPAFLTGVAFVSVFGAASSLTANLTQLIAMRFGVGVGIGGFTVPFDLLAESCPSTLRGVVLCAVWIFWTFGSVALNVVAAYCLSDSNTNLTVEHYTAGAGSPSLRRYLPQLVCVECMSSTKARPGSLRMDANMRQRLSSCVLPKLTG